MTLILFTIYIYYISYKPPKKYLYILAVSLIIMLPVLGHLKNIFTKDATDAFNEYNVIFAIFQGEFLSAGRNFETILNARDTWDFFLGETVFWDLGRSLVPSFVYQVENSIGWFNNTYHPEIVAAGQGYGFSFIAEGYINFGYFGVVLWYLFLAFLLNYFYQKANENTYWFVAYVYMIPICIYIQRGDLSNLISPMLKQVLFFTVLLIMVNLFIKQLSRAKK
jgi:oligosaccharide repeat unit polymerase